jgi:GTPase SAR1 family protein
MTNLRNWGYLGLLGLSTVAIAFYWQHWEFLSVVIGGIGAIAFLKTIAPQSTGPNQPLTRSTLLKSLNQVNRIISKISDRPTQINLKTAADQIQADLNQNQFRIAVFGMSSAGKTSVINALLSQNLLSQNLDDQKLIDQKLGVTAPTLGTTQSPQIYSYKDKLADKLATKRKISLIDTPGLQNRGARGLTQEATAISTAESSDLLLFVTSGDLGAIEYQALISLEQLGKRIILVFNKIDQYLPTDRDAIVAELQHKTAKFLLPADVVAIAANPDPITVRQYENVYIEQPKLIKEWLEPCSPDISALKARIEYLLSSEWEELLLLNSNYRLQQLHKSAQTSLQKIRHQQGHAIISRYQWLNAGVIFASPIPAIDLIASVAINAKLLMELSQIYERQLSLKQAQKMAVAMAEILIKLGCVEVATVAIASQASYFLKTNAVTFAVGGTVQAVSAAYLTYIGGVSFLDYLDQTPELDFTSGKLPENMIDSMINICRANFAKMKEIGFIQDFVNQTISNFSPSLHP